MRPRLLNICFFFIAVCVGLLGILLALDTLIPKERHVSTLSLVGEFACGLALLLLGVYLAKRNRLRPPPES